ncbi:hypothetical protein IV203_019063 [Nitzschia inconspicua]|uniref:Uncharacterized protein n=1 Tax=Nitzschia inconspicua TaxID=303405 RepID=A0A9K3LXP5_9STRA|nr:hypothetical protein IV203_019063 [Nitzschia inconspicua]
MTFHKTDNHSNHVVHAGRTAAPSIVTHLCWNKTPHPRKISCDHQSSTSPSSIAKTLPEEFGAGVKRKHCRRNSVVITEKLESFLYWEDFNQTSVCHEKREGSKANVSLHIETALEIGNAVSSGDSESKRQKRELPS